MYKCLGALVLSNSLEEITTMRKMLGEGIICISLSKRVGYSILRYPEQLLQIEPKLCLSEILINNTARLCIDFDTDISKYLNIVDNMIMEYCKNLYNIEVKVNWRYSNNQNRRWHCIISGVYCVECWMEECIKMCNYILHNLLKHNVKNNNVSNEKINNNNSTNTSADYVSNDNVNNNSINVSVNDVYSNNVNNNSINVNININNSKDNNVEVDVNKIKTNNVIKDVNVNEILHTKIDISNIETDNISIDVNDNEIYNIKSNTNDIEVEKIPILSDNTNTKKIISDTNNNNRLYVKEININTNELENVDEIIDRINRRKLEINNRDQYRNSNNNSDAKEINITKLLCIDFSIYRQTSSLRMLGQYKYVNNKYCNKLISLNTCNVLDCLLSPSINDKQIKRESIFKNRFNTTKVTMNLATLNNLQVPPGYKLGKSSMIGHNCYILKLDRIYKSYCIICRREHENENAFYVIKIIGNNYSIKLGCYRDIGESKGAKIIK